MTDRAGLARAGVRAESDAEEAVDGDGVSVVDGIEVRAEPVQRHLASERREGAARARDLDSPSQGTILLGQEGDSYP